MSARNPLEAIANNLLLVVISRIAVPVLLACVGWTALQLFDHDRRLAVLEVSREHGRQEITSRLDKLEDHDRNDAQSNARILSEISGLVATQGAILRELDRLNRALENGTRR